MLRRALIALLGSTAFIACGPATEAPERRPLDELSSDAAQDELFGSGEFTYYVVTRQDFRKCAYPICGGYFVRRVNRAYTQCSDGSWAQECHAVSLDLSALKLSDASKDEFASGAYAAGTGIVRGALVNQKGASTLVAESAWAGATGNTPVGLTHRVFDNGIRCFTSPCPSTSEATLNTYFEFQIDGVDLARSGADPKLVDQGYAALADGGVLVAGLHSRIKGPGGHGWMLNAYEFYLPLRDTAHCAIVTVDGPSPTFYAKNVSSEQEGWDFINQSFPYGINAEVFAGSCDQPRPCIKVYKPVCGVVKDGPDNTYGNSCEFEGAILSDAGSAGESKGFYSAGECPSCDVKDPNQNYLSTDPKQCQLMKFACEAGSQPFFNDCGCGCEVAKATP